MGPRAWTQKRYAIAVRHPGAGLHLARHKRILTRAFLGAFPSAQDAHAWAEALHTYGRLDTGKFLTVQSAPASMAIDWAQRKMLPLETLLSRYPDLREDQLQGLADAGLLSRERWLAYGAMPQRLIVENIQAGHWTPLRCIATGIVPDALLQTWVEQGCITWRLFATHHAKVWHPSRPLDKTPAFSHHDF